MRFLKIAGATVGIGLSALMGACVLWIAVSPAGGVRLGNEMHPYALEYLEKHSLLEPGENVVAYYDVTLSMDGSEAAILTDRRVLYHHEGRTSAIALAEIEEISHRYESYVGDVIELQSRDGQFMKITIAPMNMGETFLRALRAGHERAGARSS